MNVKREKTPKLIITFDTSAAAMAMESACDKSMGRLIPVPQQISAGCGLAWSAAYENKDELIEFMQENGLEYKEIAVVEMY